MPPVAVPPRPGNLPPAPPKWKAPAYTPEVEQARDKEWVASAAGEAELREDAEDAFDDDRFLEEYR